MREFFSLSLSPWLKDELVSPKILHLFNEGVLGCNGVRMTSKAISIINTLADFRHPLSRSLYTVDEDDATCLIVMP